MAGMTTKKLPRWLKVHPSITAIIIAGVILLVTGIGIEIYGMLARPDLRWRLVYNESGVPPDLHEEPIYPMWTDECIRENFGYYLAAGLPVQYPDETANFTLVDIDICIVSDNRLTINKTLTFQFDPSPGNIVRKVSPATRFEMNPYIGVPVTVYADFGDRVQVATQIIDIEGNVVEGCSVEVSVPPVITVARAELGYTCVAGVISLNEEAEDCMAIGFNFTGMAHKHREDDWVVDYNDEAYRQPYGILIVPVSQDSFSPPSEILNFPKAPDIWPTKPYGKWSLFIETGSSKNYWFCKPDGTENYAPEEAGLWTSDDLWCGMYLYDVSSGEILERLRLGEGFDHESAYYRRVIARSNHPTESGAGEFNILAWPCMDNNSVPVLYNYYTVSDTNQAGSWSFEPDEPVEIEYGHQIDRSNSHETMFPVSFEDYESRLGFVIINDDGTAGILRQPEGHQPVELIATVLPPSTNGDTDSYIQFLGLVPYQDGEGAFAFSTDGSRIVICDEYGEQLAITDIRDHFVFNTYDYHCVSRLANKSQYYKGPAYTMLENRDTGETILAKLIFNAAWDPYWASTKRNVWIALFIVFVGLSLLIFYYFTNKGWFSYSELTSRLGTERAVRRQMPGFAAAHEASIYSAVFHEMGKFISTMRAFTQRDYRLIAQVEEIISRPEPDLDEARELLGELKGRDRYDEITGEARDYLSMMENARDGFIRLDALVTRVLTLHRNYLTRNLTAVVSEIDPCPLKVPTATSLVLDTLLNNAIEAVNNKRAKDNLDSFEGRVRIKLKGIDRGFVLSFEDNGNPITDSEDNTIDAAQWGQIFAPGYSTKPSEKGHGGLGLAIAKEFADNEGWRLYVEPSGNPAYTKRFVLEIPTNAAKQM